MKKNPQRLCSHMNTNHLPTFCIPLYTPSITTYHVLLTVLAS